jgi:hypothetical protein
MDKIKYGAGCLAAAVGTAIVIVSSHLNEFFTIAGAVIVAIFVYWGVTALKS